MKGESMRAVLTVIGNDKVGVLAEVSRSCAECGANIIDVQQTLMEETFVMVMMCDIKALNRSFNDFVTEMGEVEKRIGLKVNVMHEDIFNSMHRI